MKTYTYLVGILLTIFLISCSSESNVEPIDSDTLINSNYSVLLQGSSGLYAQMLLDIPEGLSINEEASSFPGFSTTDVTYRTDSQLSLYSATGDCSGEVLLYDFADDSSTSFEVFSDLAACTLTVTAIAHTTNKIFLSYFMNMEGKEKSYFVRTIKLDTENKDFVDFELSEKPLELAIANNRLFILTFDEEITDENGLVVIEISSGASIHDTDIGFDARKIFKDPNDNIIISYPELHTTMNSSTLGIVYTQYGEGTEPNFVDSEAVSFDSKGNMYYHMKPMISALTETIPAVYNFEDNTAVLYFFENFLSPSQLNVEFNVDKATAIAYDEANNMILIGYQKKDAQTKGGIIRITPSPELSFVDNIDVDGVPYKLFIN